MKITQFLLGILFLLFGIIGVSAQVVTPAPISGDKNLEDRNVKNRSVDLERVERDARKADAVKSQQQQKPEQLPAAKFEEIKADFEGIQLRQDEIVSAYKAKIIDLTKISGAAEQMNKSGVRLESNLFPLLEDPKKSKKKSIDQAPAAPDVQPKQDLKTLIVELDNAIAAFAGNAMFTNPQVANAEDNLKAHAALQKVIRLSSELKREADKPAAKQ